MPQRRAKKTRRGETPRIVFENAAAAVRRGESSRSAAKLYGIDRMTLTRYITKLDKSLEPDIGYDGIRKKKQVFPDDMEKDLADHIKLLAGQFYGLSRRKCQQLAFEVAVQNGLSIPDSWRTNQHAGDEWYRNFAKRQALSIRTPEATSRGRASAFNRMSGMSATAQCP